MKKKIMFISALIISMTTYSTITIDGTTETNTGEIGSVPSTIYRVEVINGGNFINDGTFYFDRYVLDYGIKAVGSTSSATNNGDVYYNGHYAMHALDGATVTNSSTGILRHTGSDGMIADSGGQAINYGIVKGQSTAMRASGNGSIVTNYGELLNTNSRGISVSNGGEGYNRGIINISTSSRYWSGSMYSYGGYLENSETGEINSGGQVGMGIDGRYGDSLIVNKGIIQNNGVRGIQVYEKGEADNFGVIENNGDFGMEFWGTASDPSYGAVRNQATGIIRNNGDYGMKSDGSNANAINFGDISNTGNYGMYILNESNGMNSGTISNTGDYGMYAESNNGLGTLIINDATGTISNTGNYGMAAINPMAFAINYGDISIDGQTSLLVDNGAYAENHGTINVTATDGIGMKATLSNLYNSGTINADGLTAIEMDEFDSILELSSGTNLLGRTDGLDGEDTLILSGIGNIDVGDHSVYNFEKLVVTGDVVADGTYNIGITDGSDYESTSFGPVTTYSIDDATGATGNLTVDGIINLDVDYDGITATGTNKTGRIIANTITLGTGSINLVNGGSTSSSIIDELTTNDSTATAFRVEGLATVSGAQVVDPTLFTTTSDTGGTNWESVTVGDRVGTNGSILLDQAYTYVKPTPTPDPAPAPAPGGGSSGSSSSVGAVTPNISKILIPRNRVDLDNIEELDSNLDNFKSLAIKNLKIDESQFTVEYLGTKDNSSFELMEDYNYGYDVDADGFFAGYIHKLNKNLSFGTGFTYKDSNLVYDGTQIDNISIESPTSKHTEEMDSYNAQIFTRYEVNNFGIELDLGYGLTEHHLMTNFTSDPQEAYYKSHILKTGLKTFYEFNLTENISIIPNIGIDYLHITEEEFKYNNGLEVEETTGNGLVGNAGLDLQGIGTKLSWKLGAGYRYYNEDTFHNERSIVGYNLEVEKLYYDKEEVYFHGNLLYNLTETIGITAGYQYTHNLNYQNHEVSTGLTIKF